MAHHSRLIRPSARRCLLAAVLVALAWSWAQSVPAAQAAPACFPPTSGDWLIAGSCSLQHTVGTPGSIVVQNGAVLTVEPGVVLGVDFSQHRVEVKKGGQLRLRTGARMEQLRLAVVGLEATQAVQNLEGTVQLVTGKDTVVRAYVEALTSSVSPVRVRLHGSRGGTTLPGSPLAMFQPGSITASGGALARRNNLNDSANFSLPTSWATGTIELLVEGDGVPIRCREQAGADNDCSVTMTFEDRHVPTYWYLPVNTGTTASPTLPTTAEMNRQRSYLETVYPVRDVDFVLQPWQAIGATTVNNTINALNGYYVNTLIAWIFGTINTGQPPFTMPEQIYGFTAPGGGISDPVWASGAGRVARGGQGTSREGTMAHEINHNLDRSSNGTWGRHVGNPATVPNPTPTPGTQPVNDANWGCGASGPDPNYPGNASSTDQIGDTGMDTRLPWSATGTTLSVVPANFPDLMSYCQSDNEPGMGANQVPTKWTSAYRWGTEYGAIGAFSATTAAQVAGPLQGRFETVYYVEAVLNVDGTGVLRPVRQLPGFPSTEIRPGEYAVELRDSAGAALAALPFQVQFVDPDGNPVETVVQRLQLAARPDVAQIALRRGDLVLDTIVVSPHDPVVRVLTPNGGESWSTSGTVGWSATDEDGGTLTADVYYTPDDGRSWVPIAWDVQGDSIEVDASALPGGVAARVRVIVTDGFRTAQDDSDGTFLVGRKPPVANIVRPIDGTEYDIGGVIQLEGEGSDPEDGAVPGDRLRWTAFGSDRVIGIGERVAVRALQLGRGSHRIVLTVTDSDGIAATDDVTVVVSSPWAPTYLPFTMAGARDAPPRSPPPAR